jgi:glucose-1-phosphate thymidylyltransferase
MKGVILAGGHGTRMGLSTRVTNKHLLPVYDQPMIMFPLESLINNGIRDIMIISGRGHAGHFLELLGSGRDLGVRIQYALQEEAGGIAQALSQAEDFADRDNIAVILGDNIYRNPPNISNFVHGARVYLKRVKHPGRFGVATVEKRKVVKIIEKPTEPETNLAVTGFYLYDNTIFDKIRQLKPSPPPRSELEITDANNMYIEESNMQYRMIKGFWSDAGTQESLYHSAGLVRRLRLQNQS